MDDDDVWAVPLPPPAAAESEAAWWRGWRGALLIGLALGEVEPADPQGATERDVDVTLAGQDAPSAG